MRVAALGLSLAGLACRAAQPALVLENEQMFQRMQQERGLTSEQMERLRAIFARSGFMGQGNPAISVHPVTEDGCRKQLEQQHIDYSNTRFAKICGAKYMAPLYDPKTTTAEHAKVCIDQFEYPGHSLRLSRWSG